jgi:hypothetical protein
VARPPADFILPGKKELAADLKTAIAACADMFGGVKGITTVTFTGLSKRAKKGEKTNAEAAPSTESN